MDGPQARLFSIGLKACSEFSFSLYEIAGTEGQDRAAGLGPFTLNQDGDYSAGTWGISIPHHFCSIDLLKVCALGLLYCHRLNLLWSQFLYMVSCCQNSDLVAAVPQPKRNALIKNSKSHLFIIHPSIPFLRKRGNPNIPRSLLSNLGDSLDQVLVLTSEGQAIRNGP